MLQTRLWMGSLLIVLTVGMLAFDHLLAAWAYPIQLVFHLVLTVLVCRGSSSRWSGPGPADLRRACCSSARSALVLTELGRRLGRTSGAGLAGDLRLARRLSRVGLDPGDGRVSPAGADARDHGANLVGDRLPRSVAGLPRACSAGFFIRLGDDRGTAALRGVIFVPKGMPTSALLFAGRLFWPAQDGQPDRWSPGKAVGEADQQPARWRPS